MGFKRNDGDDRGDRKFAPRKGGKGGTDPATQLGVQLIWIRATDVVGLENGVDGAHGSAQPTGRPRSHLAYGRMCRPWTSAEGGAGREASAQRRS